MVKSFTFLNFIKNYESILKYVSDSVYVYLERYFILNIMFLTNSYFLSLIESMYF